MSKFEFRGLEFHSSRMWRWSSVEKATQFMAEHNMNALIFHQNDLIDELVLPEIYFSDEVMLQRWPVRRSTIFANRMYMNRVIEMAGRAGIDFYLEVKEIWYPEALIDLHPELRTTEGCICPTNPFWFEFLRTKMEELLKYLPDIAGVIVSPATRESKVSISTNPCECSRCEQTNAVDWYKQYIQAIYEPLSAQQKTLVVRDFAYSSDQQNSVLEAAVACSKDIVLGLKNVPHDFWPTYPNNPKIGHSNGLRQWIEFDVWGQYAGMGVFPCSLLEDLQRRIKYCKEQGAVGAWFRTDWEICIEASNFNSLNMLNLIGAAMLSIDSDLNLDEIYKAWTRYGLYSPLQTESCTGDPVVPASQDAWKQLKHVMTTSWSIMEKSLFIQGNVFQLSSKVHPSLNDMFYIMTKHHNRGNWEENALDVLDDSEQNIQIILNEKEEAVQQLLQLQSTFKPDELGLPERFKVEIEELLELFQYYIKSFYYAAYVGFLGRRALNTKRSKDMDQAERYLNELLNFQQELKQRLKDTDYPYYVYWLLDEKQLKRLHDDIRTALDGIERSAV